MVGDAVGARKKARRLWRLLFGARNATEIDRVRAALERHQARVDAMSDEWARLRAPCCPGCMFGAEYSSAVAQCERTAGWLRVLLCRRGSPDDIAEAARLDVDYPARAP